MKGGTTKAIAMAVVACLVVSTAFAWTMDNEDVIRAFKLARHQRGGACKTAGQYCSAFEEKFCCEGLHCEGPIIGACKKCVPTEGCWPGGYSWHPLCTDCCNPYVCAGWLQYDQPSRQGLITSVRVVEFRHFSIRRSGFLVGARSLLIYRCILGGKCPFDPQAPTVRWRICFKETVWYTGPRCSSTISDFCFLVYLCNFVDIEFHVCLTSLLFVRCHFSYYLKTDSKWQRTG